MSHITFDEIRNKLMLHLTQEQVLESTLQAFALLKSDNERLVATYSLLKQSGLLPSFSLKNEKSNELSKTYRVAGNDLFYKQRGAQAFEQYTLAIGYAPDGSEELALAFANRSAVTASLGQFEDSINDIEMALRNSYPNNLKYKLFDRKGRSLMQLRDCRNAAEAFQMAVDHLPQANFSPEKEKRLRDDMKILLMNCQNWDLAKITRKTDCTVPPLVNGPHDRIESASCIIDIAYSNTMGRHIVATADIKAGDVLAIEIPYTSILLPDSYMTHCFACQKRSHSLLPCSQCTKVFYCSEKCLKNNWEQSHSIECTVLSSLLSLSCNKMELLATRILMKASKKGSELVNLAFSLSEMETVEKPEEKGFKNGRYLSSDYITTHLLEGNTHCRKPCDLLGRAVVAVCIIEAIDYCSEYFKSIEKQSVEDTKMSLLLPIFNSIKESKSINLSWQKIVAGGLILRYLQSMPCNAHEVLEMCVTYKKNKDIQVESIEIGGAVYPLLSLINHSCDPNVVRHSYCGDTVVLTAIQAIQAGGQIFDNYGYHHAVHDIQKRQEHLKSQYYFKCDCVACTEDWPMYLNLPDTNPMYFISSNLHEVDESSKKFREILKDILSGNTNGKLPFLCSHLNLLHKSVSRPWKEYSECQESIKQCLSLQANHYVNKSN